MCDCDVCCSSNSDLVMMKPQCQICSSLLKHRGIRCRCPAARDGVLETLPSSAHSSGLGDTRVSCSTHRLNLSFLSHNCTYTNHSAHTKTSSSQEFDHCFITFDSLDSTGTYREHNTTSTNSLSGIRHLVSFNSQHQRSALFSVRYRINKQDNHLDTFPYSVNTIHLG